MVFRVPSSTPPSTPDSRRSSFRNAPSTTPAGPPPSRSMIASSTPAGPPPPSLFGSSQFAAGSYRKPHFQPHALGSSPPKENTLFGVGRGQFGAPTSSRPMSRGRPGFRGPSSTPPHAYVSDEAEEEEVDESYEEDEYEEEEDEEMGSEEEDEDMDEDDYSDEDAEGDEDEDDDLPDIVAFKRTPFKSARDKSLTEQSSSPTVLRASARQAQYDLLKLAKGLTSNADRIPIRESDEMILETERLMGKLHQSMSGDTVERRTEVLADVAQELVTLWRTSSPLPGSASIPSNGRPGAGPPIINASKLASLLLQIHYPGRPDHDRKANKKFSIISTRQDSRHSRPVPKALIDWMHENHPTSGEVGEVLAEQRGYSASGEFWNAVKHSVLRGNFSTAVRLLEGARFEVAETSGNDGLGRGGYRGAHLDNIEKVVASAIAIIQSCPAVSADDWDVKGNDWAVYRRRVTQALSELQDFAEGQDRRHNTGYRTFSAENFGISQNALGLSEASRKAESRVPWTVYQNLSTVYKQLLGGEEEILGTALDWVEAVVALTVFWDGEDDDIPQSSLAASRRSLARSQRARPVDVTPVQAYCQRLSSAFAATLESEEELDVNTTDAYEVGLACIFDGNTEGILQILRGWSRLISAAVAEVASSGGWFGRAGGIMNQFDQSDLMVLSFNEDQRQGLTKDDLLIKYAELLGGRNQVTSADKKTTREGWELAIQILDRLDDERLANERIEQQLNDLPIQSSDRVDKVLALCSGLSLTEHAYRIASKYADHLSKNTQNYGDTLTYYARAHNATKIREVLQILVSHCLVKSMAYPPLAEVDDRLKSLITAPKRTLTELARIDSEAAHLLSNFFSGYATIRKFYDLRDEEILAGPGEKPSLRPMARKRAAAAALVVIIQSAVSSVRGGLYDPSVETVVQVDVLLCLLGEALVFVNQPKRTLTLQQLYALLSAVEDVDTAPSLIRAQCEECFTASIAAAHSTQDPPPRSALYKSTSNLTTASSQFSLIGSADLGGTSVEGQSTDSSTVLVRGGNVDDTKRAWDWRKGFKKDAKAESVIRVLRLGLAHEIGRAFTEGEL